MLLTHHNMTLVVRSPSSVDLLDPSTGRWINTHSLRAAKWNAAVWKRLSGKLSVTQEKAS